jgi:hypothetical protein
MNAAVGCIDSGYVCVARSACEEQQSHTCGTVVADMSQSLQYQGVKTAGQAPRPSRRGESRRGLCCEDLVVDACGASLFAGCLAMALLRVLLIAGGTTEATGTGG